MINLANKKILITGGESMIARHIRLALASYESLYGTQVCYTRHKHCDLLNKDAAISFFNAFKPNYAIFCQGYNGNVDFNGRYQYDIFWKSTIMSLNCLEAARHSGVEKVVNILTSCSYQPSEKKLKEEDYLKGEIHGSVACHGWAKRVSYIGGLQAKQQYKLNVVNVVLNNSFGEWDSFDLAKTKVIGSLIAKFCDAVQNRIRQVSCWGDGSTRREILYARDAGVGIVKALEMFEDDSCPIINIGNGVDYSIKEIAELIGALTGFKGEIVWDKTKPSGQSVKILDNSKMIRVFNGWGPKTDIQEGLMNTINYYRHIKGYNTNK